MSSSSTARIVLCATVTSVVKCKHGLGSQRQPLYRQRNFIFRLRCDALPVQRGWEWPHGSVLVDSKVMPCKGPKERSGIPDGYITAFEGGQISFWDLSCHNFVTAATAGRFHFGFSLGEASNSFATETAITFRGISTSSSRDTAHASEGLPRLKAAGQTQKYCYFFKSEKSKRLFSGGKVGLPYLSQ